MGWIIFLCMNNEHVASLSASWYLSWNDPFHFSSLRWKCAKRVYGCIRVVSTPTQDSHGLMGAARNNLVWASLCTVSPNSHITHPQHRCASRLSFFVSSRGFILLALFAFFILRLFTSWLIHILSNHSRLLQIYRACACHQVCVIITRCAFLDDSTYRNQSWCQKQTMRTCSVSTNL